MNWILLLIFVKCILIDICVRFLFHLWNSLDMVMQETCMVFRVLDPGQVLNLTDLVALFCFQIVLFVSVLMFVLFFFPPPSSRISTGEYFSYQVEVTVWHYSGTVEYITLLSFCILLEATLKICDVCKV